jgi:glycosyltransferase involved in cell wall biosynthesis
MKKILIVSPVVSHPALSGNSTRIQQMAACLAALGCEVHFLLCPLTLIQDRRSGSAMADHYGSRYRELHRGRTIVGNPLHQAWRLLMRLGMRKLRWAQDTTWTTGIFSAQDQQEFRQVVDEIDPQVVIFEYVVLAELADQLAGGRRIKVVDTHDCFSDRNRRIRASGGTGTWWSLRPQQERRLLCSFDHALAIQQNEASFFRDLLAGSATKVALVDILSAPAEHHTQGTPSNGVVGYIGSANQHNLEGLRLFLDAQWPQIRRTVPSAQLIVAGGLAMDRVIDGVRFVGRVDDLWQDFYRRCSLIVNPCVSGTGLKIKTVEAMSYGLPVVTTDEGCSGIESAVGQGAYALPITSPQFHQTCATLLQDDDARAHQGRLARGFIEASLRRSVSTLEAIIP